MRRAIQLAMLTACLISPVHVCGGTLPGATPINGLSTDEDAAHRAAATLERYRPGKGLPAWSPNPIVADTAPPQGRYYQPLGHTWIQVDYLMWWLQGPELPGLATDSGGDWILGNGRLNMNHHDGIRLRAGRFLNCEGTCGIMVDMFGFDSSGEVQRVSGPGAQFNFTDMDLSLPANQSPGGCACLDGLEGTATSVPLDTMSVVSDTEIFSGGIYGQSRLNSCYACCAQDCRCRSGAHRCGFRLDAFYGYRYFGLDETLQLDTRLIPTTGTVAGFDRFRSQNRFHGVDVGLSYEIERNRWSLSALGRLGLGVNHQQLSVRGFGNQTGGILAQPTNIGDYEHDAFMVLPELNLTLSYALTPRLRARLGYSFLLLSNVLRPASQLDTRLDGRYLDAAESRPLDAPRSFFPRTDLKRESVWLQGLNFGMEYWF